MDLRTDRRTARRLTVIALLLPLLAGCAHSNGGEASGTGSPISPSASESRPAPAPASASSAASTPSATPFDLRSELTGLVSDSSVDLEIVVAGTGSSSTGVGEVDADTAWSTMKVPIAIAALQNGSAEMDDVKAAITLSDNDAAIDLWNSLGAGDDAANTVQAVIRRFGDSRTVVLPDDRAGADEPFGMTRWTAADQVRFVEGLACTTDPSAVKVRDYMGQIDPSEQFGLAGVHPSMVKAGWGNEDNGDYTVRQMAILPHDGGYSAVTFIAQGSEDEVDRTVANLKTWFAAHRKELPVRHCS